MFTRDLWHHGAGWAMDQIGPYVSEKRRLELGSVLLDMVTVSAPISLAC